MEKIEKFAKQGTNKNAQKISPFSRQKKRRSEKQKSRTICANKTLLSKANPEQTPKQNQCEEARVIWGE